MKSMKILIIMIAVFTLIFAGGCEAGIATNEQELVNHETVDGKISITATLFPQYDFAREIG
jgi:ABC-type Zn uptake system ZnuABC Zn-binding protein ZnuA